MTAAPEKKAEPLPAIHKAAQDGDLIPLQAELNGGVDANLRETSWNLTPLMLSAGLGHVEACRILLEAKADVNARDKGIWTAVRFDMSIVQRRAPLNEQLMKAMNAPQCREETCRLLLEHRASWSRYYTTGELKSP